MTMILSLANRDNVIHLSDRRLTFDHHIIDEEAGKAGTLICKNGRFAFGFTGIAIIGGFEIRRWILDTLYESGPPDYLMGNILSRFSTKATNFFKNDQNLQNLSLLNKKLEIIFTGFLNTYVPPIIGCAIVSNFTDLANKISTSKSWGEFKISLTKEKIPLVEKSTFVHRIGTWPAMTNQDEISLRSMLYERKPAKAIIGKAIKLILTMADRHQANGKIGNQISWIRIPSSNSEDIEIGYYSNMITHSVFIPSQVIVTSDENRFCIDSPQISAVDRTTTPPMLVPKVHKNAPCSCGSGKKYKDCHGRKKTLKPPKIPKINPEI